MKSMKKRIRIAIDGPAGAGKTTLARKLAQRLGYKYIDTGAMYRAIAWKALQLGIPLDETESIARLASEAEINFPDGDASRIIVDGVDVSREIRTPEVTRLSSPVSAISGVRKHLVAQQRRLAEGGGVVMEGRDIGSVVLPDAELKIFLIASVEERARRRAEDLKAMGEEIDMAALQHEIEIRDNRDSTRADSPLVKVPDAIEVISDGMSPEEVVSRVIELAQQRGLCLV